MRSGLLMICIILATVSLAAGQEGDWEDLLGQMDGRQTRGPVRIFTDSLLEANYYKLLVSNSQVNGVPGYRIRIFSESGLGAKEEQQRVRARFLSLYPDVDAYYRYDEPYFKVYVGDCRTRSEALKLFDRVEKNFSNPILVEDFIEIQ